MKIQELLLNEKIIRNRLKINASINNSRIFKKIQNEYGTFHEYLKSFTNDRIVYETGKTTSELSNKISKDLKKKGMKFVGSTIIYSYLQAIGIIYSKSDKFKNSFKAKRKWSSIEVVITSLTRNQVVRKGPWVRIPPAPPRSYL